MGKMFLLLKVFIWPSDFARKYLLFFFHFSNHNEWFSLVFPLQYSLKEIEKKIYPWFFRITNCDIRGSLVEREKAVPKSHSCFKNLEEA